METGYYYIDGDYGWNQEKFTDPIMKGGGCAAVTACDICIFLSRLFGEKNLYPFNPHEVTDADYKKFSRIMKPYLHPRLHGIDKLETYIDGLGKYFSDTGSTHINMRPFPGEKDVNEAVKAVMKSIDAGIPLACLTLKHKDSRFDDYTWHWYMITGYDTIYEKTWVKAVSYGEWTWLDFEALWDTGYTQKGGLVFFHIEE